MSEWISVDDRLPEIGGRGVYASHIVLAYDGVIKDVVFATFIKAGKLSYWKVIYTEEEAEITHWMPLPEPPEGLDG